MSRANFNSSHDVSRSLEEELMEEGRTYYKAKEYEKALVAYREAIGINPTNAAAYVGQGNCFYKLEQYEPALNAYDQAIHNDPKNVAAYNGRSYVYIKKHLKETPLLTNYRGKADLANKKALALDPKSAAAFNARGQLLEIEDQYQGALESFEEAIKLATDEDNLAGYYYNKALVLNKLGIYKNALKMLEIAIDLDNSNPRFTKLHDEITAKYKSQRDHENSFRERQPGNIFEHLGKGKALSDQQHYEEALKEYELALLIDPSNVRANTGKGDNLLKINRYQEAIRAYDKALKKQANFTFAHAGKGHALYALNYFAKALKS